MDELQKINEEEYNLNRRLLGVYPDEYERDKEKIKELYFSVWRNKKELPSFRDIQIEVMEYNSFVCDQIAEYSFNKYYKEQLITELCERNKCTPDQLTAGYIKESEITMINAMSTNLLNDINFSDVIERGDCISSCIHDALDDLDYVYEDNDGKNPLFGDLGWNYDTHMIIRNNAQLVMFSGIFKEQYSKTRRRVEEILQGGMLITKRPVKELLRLEE